MLAVQGPRLLDASRAVAIARRAGGRGAAKRLLLFAQLALRNTRPADARNWLRQAMQLAPGDPEIRRFAREFARPQS